MSNVVSSDNTAKNTGLDAELALADGKVVNVYALGGSAVTPATPATALTDQVLLFSGLMGSPAFGAAVAGVATANAMTGGTAGAAGTPAFFRIVSTGTLGRFQGSAGTSGTAMILNRATIQPGDVVALVSCAMTRS